MTESIPLSPQWFTSLIYYYVTVSSNPLIRSAFQECWDFLEQHWDIPLRASLRPSMSCMVSDIISGYVAKDEKEEGKSIGLEAPLTGIYGQTLGDGNRPLGKIIY